MNSRRKQLRDGAICGVWRASQHFGRSSSWAFARTLGTAGGLLLAHYVVSLNLAEAQTPHSKVRRTPHASSTRLDRIGVNWSHVSLGRAMGSLREATGCKILLDRRLDPERPLSIALQDADAFAVVEAVAERNGWSTTRIAELMYLGPADASGELQALIALRNNDVAGLPTGRRSRYLRQQAISWPRLTEPRSLLVRVAADAHLQVKNAKLVAHDLWPAGASPELPVVEQLSLLLIGFDMTFRIEEGGHALRLLPIERPVEFSRQYELPADKLPTDLQQVLSNAELQVDGRRVTLRGEWHHHQQLAELLQPTAARQRPQSRRSTRQVFSLEVNEQPVGLLLDQLAQRMELQLYWDDAARERRNRRVTFRVREAALVDLLDAALAPAGLAADVDGTRIHVKIP